MYYDTQITNPLAWTCHIKRLNNKMHYLHEKVE